MDIIFIKDLRILTIIGIYDWERTTKQDVLLDLDMAFDISTAASTDHIENALNYKAVSKRVIAFVEAAQFQLVETLAEKVAQIILTEFPVKWIRVRVNKQGAVSAARDVGVIIERSAPN